MSERARELAGRIKALTQQMTDFVQGCPDDAWTWVSVAEQWPVCVFARHFAAGHLEAQEMAQMIVVGKDLPLSLTMEAIDQSNAEHDREHTERTQEEVLGFLRQNGEAFEAFLEDSAVETWIALETCRPPEVP